MKKYLICLPLLILAGCQTAPNFNPSTPSPLLNSSSTRAVTDVRYSYSSDRSELIITMTHDSGDTVEYSLVRRPVDGSTVTAQTTIKRNTVVVSSTRTTPTEAQLVLKAAANNGWQDVFRDLKERYRLIGLVNT
jgi:hypothetical protein